MRPTVVLAATLAALALSACAEAAPEGSSSPSSAPSAGSAPPPSSKPPLSNLPPPTLGPPSPPAPGKVSPPSDPQPVDIVVGRVVRGGSGPCYGVENDDGMLYAVYSPDAGDLAVGTTVMVKTKPLLLKIYCGEGQHVAAVSVEIVR